MRTTKDPVVRRQELIEIALRQFLIQGYEKTSVRSILKEADGEIGMFYHYFKSKNEIYEAALAFYNDIYIAKVAEIAEDPAVCFEDKLKLIFLDLSASVSQYSTMQTSHANPEIMTVLLSKTLLRLVPLFDQVILEEITQHRVEPPIANTHLLSQFILFGVSAIIHDTTINSMEEKMHHAKRLIASILKPKGEIV